MDWVTAAGVQGFILVSILMVTMMVLVAETIHLQYSIMIITTAAAVLDGRWNKFVTFISFKSALIGGASVPLWCLPVREIGMKEIKRAWVMGLPWWSRGKESALQCRGCGFDPWSGN